MKLLLITYYGERDSLLYAANSLRKIGYDVINYPLFQYSEDTHSKLDNYLQHFDTFINDENPSVILWWYLPNVDCLKHIYNLHKDRLHTMFNWDDPFVWDIQTHTKIDKKSKFFDIAFISCEHSINNYISNGTPEAYRLYPGYDPSVNFPKNNTEFKYDVSIGITNLYEDKNFYKDQIINRKEFIDNLTSITNLKIAIYGPEKLRSLYPNNYIGFVNYDKLNDVFNDSKLNISLHVCNKDKYINERTILILGSGGLLFVDPVIGIQETLKDSCIYIEKDSYIQQIQHIINNYDSFQDIKLKGHTTSKQFTWDKWAEFYNEKIKCNYKYNNLHHFTKKKISSLTLDKHKLTWSHFIKFNFYFNNIKNNKEVEKNLENIFLLSKHLPYIDINKILDEYTKQAEIN
jgi:hypothetical protein